MSKTIIWNWSVSQAAARSGSGNWLMEEGLAVCVCGGVCVREREKEERVCVHVAGNTAWRDCRGVTRQVCESMNRGRRGVTGKNVCHLPKRGK